ncbi:hypothetical protein BgiBS90_008699, partial [Biomphalaria glabrata]
MTSAVKIFFLSPELLKVISSAEMNPAVVFFPTAIRDTADNGAPSPRNGVFMIKSKSCHLLGSQKMVPLAGRRLVSYC